jgi:diaminohydroxyphosphoribosylaminopyrimidine deaminase/5-amino-6-(5-phosphoribosylamino)uracil reductase
MNEEFMKTALRYAMSVKGKTTPNPAVGAVVVKNGQIVGYGSTSAAGGNHAEINAINEAKDNCLGADLYVTLEPCCHYGKTPPCCEAIVKSGIKRVFVACRDFNPVVETKGIEWLRSAGIEVDVGILEKEAIRLNEDFFYYITNKKPFIAAKLALSLDNKIADFQGESKWISGEESLKHTHFLRSIYSAIAVGKNTLLADNPKLTVRKIEGAKNPLRIVFASDKNLNKDSFFRQNAKKHRSVIVISGKEKGKEKSEDGTEIWMTGEKNYKESFLAFLEIAGKEGIDSLLIEGGAKLLATAIEAKSVNRMFLFYAPKILGGGKSGLQLNNSLSISNPVELKEIESQRLGNDILLTGIPVYPL